VTIFDRPVFIVAPPGSGASLFFETLALAPGTVTLGGEGHSVFDSFPSLAPEQRGFDSNRLLAEDAAPAVVRALVGLLRERVRDRYGQPPPIGARGFAPWIWNPKGCEITWKPLPRFDVTGPMAAFGATATLAQILFGLTTHIRRTCTSLVPKPTAVTPSTKLPLVPLISTSVSAPAGSALGEKDTAPASPLS